MSFLRLLFARKKPKVEHDPDPGVMDRMPARPYRVLHADLAFYRDSECKKEFPGARLVVLQCVDPHQEQRPIECMPTCNRYQKGDLVAWDLNSKKQWDMAWYRNPVNGIERAWSQAVEFIGKRVKVPDVM